MKTFQDLINNKLRAIEAKSKIEEFIKMFMDFGLKLDKISDKEVIFRFPNNLFDIQGEIRINLNKRYVSVEIINTCTYNSFTKVFDFTSNDILKQISNEIEKNIIRRLK